MESKPANSAIDAACERCGSFDVMQIAGKQLCVECVSLAGSSCGGAADDDGC